MPRTMHRPSVTGLRAKLRKKIRSLAERRILKKIKLPQIICDSFIFFFNSGFELFPKYTRSEYKCKKK